MPITDAQKSVAEQTQNLAVHDRRDQIRLIAGPGTGKSRSIVERVRHLLRNNADPDRIYGVSFTRASSRDLRNRVYKGCTEQGLDGNQVRISTLHSLALRMLKSAGFLSQYPSEPTVMDNWELENVFDAEFSKSCGQTPTRCENIRRDHEAYWSTGAWSPANYIPPNPPITPAERAAFDRFHASRTQLYSCVLPGEMVRKCRDSINAGNIDPVEELSIAHLIVDEYQDLNPCDQEFIDTLTSRGVITFVAGDDDQSIYSFRFASPDGIRLFLSNYPGAGVHALEHCFRCTPKVLDAAEAVLVVHSPPNRIPKNLTSLYEHSVPAVDGEVHRWRFQSGGAESKAIAESCKKLVDAGVPASEILILLSNTRVQEAEIVRALDIAEVDYQGSKSEGFRNTSASRLVLSALRVVCDKEDHVALRTILGLRRGVGDGTCNGIAEATISNNLSFLDLFQSDLTDEVFDTRQKKAITVARSFVDGIESWGA